MAEVDFTPAQQTLDFDNPIDYPSQNPSWVHPVALKLVSEDAKKFVDLIRNTRFSEGDMNIPPSKN
jgi:hypothetical protein